MPESRTKHGVDQCRYQDTQRFSCTVQTPTDQCRCSGRTPPLLLSDASGHGGGAIASGVIQPPRWRSRCRCSPAEGGADVCWTRANADRDEVGQRDLADRRPRSANREAEAVTGLQSPAATPWRSTFVTRFLAGLDEPRPRPHRPELVVSCMWQIVWTPPHGRGRRPTLSTLATSTVPLLLQPRGRRPRPNGFLFGPERPSGTSDSIRRRGDDEDRFRGWPASRAARTHVLASNRPAPLGRSEPSVVTPSFPLHRCS